MSRNRSQFKGYEYKTITRPISASVKPHKSRGVPIQQVDIVNNFVGDVSLSNN